MKKKANTKSQKSLPFSFRRLSYYTWRVPKYHSVSIVFITTNSSQVSCFEDATADITKATNSCSSVTKNIINFNNNHSIHNYLYKTTIRYNGDIFFCAKHRNRIFCNIILATSIELQPFRLMIGPLKTSRIAHCDQSPLGNRTLTNQYFLIGFAHFTKVDRIHYVKLQFFFIYFLDTYFSLKLQ